MRFISFLCVTALTACGGSQSEPATGANKTFSPALVAKLNAALEETRAKVGSKGMRAAVSIPGRGSWDMTVGTADPDKPAAYSDQHRFRIGSITKTISVTLMLRLVDEGALGLDKPISTYVDGVPGGDKVTMRHLAAMQSGLPSFSFEDDFQTPLFMDPTKPWLPQQLLDIAWKAHAGGCVNQKPACFEPGTSMFYSNTNTVLIGLACEKVKPGKTYGTLVNEYVFAPLGMKDTFQAKDTVLPPPFVRGWTIQGVDEGKPPVEATNWHPSWGYAVGDIVSTFGDMRIWARALGTGQLLSDASKKARFVAPADKNGRAYAVGIGYQKGWWGHSGELPGYSSLVNYRPDIDATIVISANSDLALVGGAELHPSNYLNDRIMDIINAEIPL